MSLSTKIIVKPKWTGRNAKADPNLPIHSSGWKTPTNQHKISIKKRDNHQMTKTVKFAKKP